MSDKRTLQPNLFDHDAPRNKSIASKKVKKRIPPANKNKVSAGSKKRKSNGKIEKKNLIGKSGLAKTRSQKRNVVVVKFYATREEKNSFDELAKTSGDSVSNIIRMIVGLQRNVSGRKKKHTTAAFDLDMDD